MYETKKQGLLQNSKICKRAEKEKSLLTKGSEVCYLHRALWGKAAGNHGGPKGREAKTEGRKAV